MFVWVRDSWFGELGESCIFDQSKYIVNVE